MNKVAAEQKETRFFFYNRKTLPLCLALCLLPPTDTFYRSFLQTLKLSCTFCVFAGRQKLPRTISQTVFYSE